MDEHYLYSSFREKTLEHIFVGDCLRALWSNGIPDAEVLRADVDGNGYDIVIEVRGVLRHIQLKASHNSARASSQVINSRLADKPSGCVVWVGFSPDTLQLGPFWWFGGRPGEPLPSIATFRRARRTTPNSAGQKPERRNSVLLKKSVCQRIDTLQELLEKLFGLSGPSPRYRAVIGV